MNGHTYDSEGFCIKCGCKKDDSLYPEGTNCPYDDWADRGYHDEEMEMKKDGRYNRIGIRI